MNTSRPSRELTKEELMLRKLRNRARQAVNEHIGINLDGFELGLSPEEVMADLDFGVGPASHQTNKQSEEISHMSDGHRVSIHTWVEEVINEGNLSLVDEIAHPNYVYRNPTEELHGREAIKGLFAAYHTGFPDFKLRIDDLVVEGDKVVQSFTLTGTHEGDFMGMAATGNEIHISGMVLSRFEDGKIIEEWEIIDELAMLQQLGVISLPIGQG